MNFHNFVNNYPDFVIKKHEETRFDALDTDALEIELLNIQLKEISADNLADRNIS